MNTNRKNNQSTAKECGILGCVISGRRFDVKTIGSMSHMTVPAQQAVFDYFALDEAGNSEKGGKRLNVH
jgi:hypothetical protein